MLVHGAEGTDTTLLVTALAQLILDPSCRSLQGFQGLLEREWIQVRAVGSRVGLPARLGVPMSQCPPPAGRAPLPVALRPLRLLPCPREAGGANFPPLPRLRVAAEPAVPFLPGIRGGAAAHPLRQCLRLRLRHLPVQQREGEVGVGTNPPCHSSGDIKTLLGTVTCPTVSHRRLCKVKESTHSLWVWLNQPEEKHKYLNPLYSHNPLVIWPSVEPQSIQLWQGELPKYPPPQNPPFSSQLGCLRGSCSAFPSLPGLK